MKRRSLFAIFVLCAFYSRAQTNNPMATGGNSRGFDMAPETRLEVVQAAAAEIPTKLPPGPFQPTWESLKANYKAPRWFAEAKFGLFLHWGIYSVPAHHNEWYEKHMYGAERQWHAEHFGPQEKFGYKDFIPMFTQEKFDPDVTRANLAGIGNVDSLSYWTFTDVFEEGGAGDTIFHGGFGMINLQGIVKPTFHAYRFMSQLGDEVIGRFAGGIATRCSKTKKLSAIAYHYPPEVKQTVPAAFDSRDQAYATLASGKPEQLNIELIGLKPGATILVETLDKENGNALAVWQQLGSPVNPSREAAKRLREMAAITKRETFAAGPDGYFRLRRPIEPWSMVLVREP